MKLARGLVSVSLIFSTAILSFISLPLTAQAQDNAKIALQRGYRTGYSDGYMAGYRDIIDGSDKNYTRHPEYARADRAFNKDYGRLEDYKDGYQQGFESGYDTGFEKRSFDAAIPANIGRRGIAQAKPAIAEPIKETMSEPAVETPTQAISTPVAESQPTAEPPAAPQAEAPHPTIQKVAYVSTDDPVIIIPRDTEIIV